MLLYQSKGEEDMKKLFTLFLLTVFTSLNYGFASEIQYEHLSQSEKVTKKAPTNLVTNDNSELKVMEYNVLEVEFAQDFSTRTAKVGDKIDFLLNDGLKTQEGTEILPRGTKLSGRILGITLPKSFNRSGKVTLKFDYFETPDGQQIPISAKLFKKDFLSRGKLNALGKGLGTTLGTTAVGVGAGCGIGVAAGAVIVGGLAIGLPVGLAVGALAGFATPGLHYKAKAGDKIMVQLTNDLTVEK